MNGEATLKNDPAPLIGAVRDSVAKKIRVINSEADCEIKIFEDDVLRNIESFRVSEKRKSDDFISGEEKRAENLLSIEMKKQKLDVIENFIKSIVSAAAENIRREKRYPEFLKGCVLSALREVKGGSATVLLSEDDMRFSEMIKDEVRISGISAVVTIRQSSSITSGGAMVVDDEPEVVFNNTVERIIYRKNDEIRRIIIRSLDEFTGGGDVL